MRARAVGPAPKVQSTRGGGPTLESASKVGTGVFAWSGAEQGTDSPEQTGRVNLRAHFS